MVLVVKNPPANARGIGDMGLIRKISWKRAGIPTPVFLPGESYGQRNLAGNSLWGQFMGSERKHTKFQLILILAF